MSNIQKLPTIPKELDPAFQVDPQNPKASPVGYNLTDIGRTSLQQCVDESKSSNCYSNTTIFQLK